MKFKLEGSDLDPTKWVEPSPPSAWSDEPPTKESPWGYWRRAHEDDQPRHISVEEFDGILSFWDGGMWRDDFASFGGQWQPVQGPRP